MKPVFNGDSEFDFFSNIISPLAFIIYFTSIISIIPMSIWSVINAFVLSALEKRFNYFKNPFEKKGAESFKGFKRVFSLPGAIESVLAFFVYTSVTILIFYLFPTVMYHLFIKP
ncbi:MAG: hypothetical protein J1E63_06775 [Muribaculaceae bacterium]|nr:hypothetical protein [Muribaculaceae bacterium]